MGIPTLSGAAIAIRQGVNSATLGIADHHLPTRLLHALGGRNTAESPRSEKGGGAGQLDRDWDCRGPYGGCRFPWAIGSRSRSGLRGKTPGGGEQIGGDGHVSCRRARAPLPLNLLTTRGANQGLRGRGRLAQESINHSSGRKRRTGATRAGEACAIGRTIWDSFGGKRRPIWDCFGGKRWRHEGCPCAGEGRTSPVSHQTKSRRRRRRGWFSVRAGAGGTGGGGAGDGGGRRSGPSSYSLRDGFGLYPWEDGKGEIQQDFGIEWVRDDVITLFTSEGVLKIGGQTVPRRAEPWQRRQMGLGGVRTSRKWREEDYMDPQQGLCLGSIFDISATNGLDMGRRLCVFGFCRSVEMLSDVVQDVVLEQGGEVLIVELLNDAGGLNERLSMMVAVPYLWGIPPAKDALRYAIRSGGGIVERVYQRWELL